MRSNEQKRKIEDFCFKLANAENITIHFIIYFIIYFGIAIP